jgi:hypothetical protein
MKHNHPKWGSGSGAIGIPEGMPNTLRRVAPPRFVVELPLIERRTTTYKRQAGQRGVPTEKQETFE